MRGKRLLWVSLFTSLSAQAQVLGIGGMKMPDGRFVQSAEAPKEAVSTLPGANIMPLRAAADGRIFPEESTRAWLAGIVTRLQSHWPHPAPPVDLRLSSGFFPPADYHAEATPDDTIIVYLGTVESAASEDELAFILAHELAHILLGHMGQEDFLAETRKTVRMAIRLNRIAAGIAALDFKPALDAIEEGVTYDAQQARKDRSKALKIQEDFRDARHDLFIPYWSRRNEDEADFLAVDLMSAAGYSPTAAQAVFERLAQASEARRNRFKVVMEEYQEFIDSLPDEVIEDEIIDAIDDPDQARERVVRARKRLTHDIGQAGRDSVLSRMRPSHRDPDKRAGGLDKYSTREHAQARDRNTREGKLPAQRGSADFRSLLQARKSILGARLHLALDEIDEALRALTPATSGKFSHYGEGRWLKHKLRLAQDEPGQALDNLALATRGSHPGVRSYERLFSGYWALQDPTAAQRWLASADSRFGDSEHFRPERIFLTRQAEGKPDSLLTACLDSVKDYIHAVCTAARYTDSADFRDHYGDLYCRNKDAGDDEPAEEPKKGKLKKWKKAAKDLFKKSAKTAKDAVTDDGC